MRKLHRNILIVIVVLVTLRIGLPYFLLYQVNESLADLDGYTGKVDDLDLNIYRGAFELERIKIEKIDAAVKYPFFEVDLVDVSVDWSAVWQGKFAGEVFVDKPILNFAIDSTGEVTQTGVEHDWLKTVEEIIPFEANLNVFELQNGKIQYNDFSQNPFVEVDMHNISILATNLSNVKNTGEELPANVNMSGTSTGNGAMDVSVSMDYMKNVPDFDLDFKLKNVDLTALNEFSNAYGKFDMEAGKFSLFSEIHMEDGNYDGYLKPLFEEVKILDWDQEQNDSFFQKVWEGIVSIPAEVLENQKEDRVATKSPIKGTIKDLDVNTLKTIKNTIKNAFIEAIPKNLEHSISVDQ